MLDVSKVISETLKIPELVRRMYMEVQREAIAASDRTDALLRYSRTGDEEDGAKEQEEREREREEAARGRCNMM